MKLYRPISLTLVFLFAITGLLFVVIPDKVLILFNHFSPSIGMPQSPVSGFSFYLILATGYMYLVTILAFLMFRHPDNRQFPMLLAQAKLASSVLSLILFMVQSHYLIYLANFIIDGFIGLVVAYLYFKAPKARLWAFS
jgi:hypothetical protein